MNNSLKLLFILNMADISLTGYLTGLGALEVNPVIRYLLSVDFLLAVAFKALVTGTFIYFAIKATPHIRSIGRMVLAANIFFALLVVYQLVGVALLS